MPGELYIVGTPIGNLGDFSPRAAQTLADDRVIERFFVDYAAARGITVMPEFDVPGHALAFRRAFGFETMRDKGVNEKLCDLVDALSGRM